MQMRPFRQRRAYPGARLLETLALVADTRSRRFFQQLILPGEVSTLVLFQQHSIHSNRCKHMLACTSKAVVLKLFHDMHCLWRRI